MASLTINQKLIEFRRNNKAFPCYLKGSINMQRIADDYSYIKEQLAKLEAEKAKERAKPADVPAPELSYDARYLHGMGGNAVNFLHRAG